MITITCLIPGLLYLHDTTHRVATSVESLLTSLSSSLILTVLAVTSPTIMVSIFCGEMEIEIN